MKRIAVILALGAALLAGAAPQSEARGPYVGLFVDSNHSAMSVYNPAGYFMPFTLYVWWLPGDDGIRLMAFKLESPSNVIVSTVTQNPLCNLGCIIDGVCCPMSDCQTDWTYTHIAQCYLTDSNPSFIRIPPENIHYVDTCAPGYPTVDATILTHVGLNQSGAYAVDPVSWGTIKSLYR